MRKVFLCLFVFVLCSVLIIGTASAWFPNTHTYILDRVEEKSAELKNISFCFDNSINEQAIRAGNILPDITGVDFDNPIQNYYLTHDWSFHQKLLDAAKTQDEKCLAYGVALHLLADGVSHKQLIPLMMKKTNLPELIIHPFTEEKYDALVVSSDRNLIDEARKSLDIFYGEEKERFVEQVQTSFGQADFDVEKRVKQLNFIVKVLNGIVTTDSLVMKIAEICCKNQKTKAESYVKESVNLILERFS